MEYVGLRWYKCDFHLHTMSSKCYKEPTKDTSDMWVAEVKNKGLQCIAITDHNDYRGIDEIKKLCEQEKIIVFPGVELSCDSSKVHLLILFDVIYNGSRVQEFLSQVSIFSDSLGDSGYTCKGDIFEVCEKAQDMGGLVIAAHIDEFSGINEISHSNIEKILNRKYINAVQIVNYNIWNDCDKNNNIDLKAVAKKLSEKYGKSISEDKAKTWYTAYLLAKKSQLPCLTFSDNPCAEKESKHGLWGIGRDYTWLKMDQNPNLESVRQALLSYDVRVKNDCNGGGKPDKKTELWIKSIEVSHTELNSKKDIIVKFNPQLNAIIGGRGSGKSSIVRMLAGGLQSFGGETLESIKNEQHDFYKLNERDKKGDKKGIFNENSVIKIYLERTGDDYKIEISDIRSMNSQTRKLFKFDGNDWGEVPDKNYLDFFKVEVYTQKQIYELALDPNSLLSIIDDGIDNSSQKRSEKESALDAIATKWFEIEELKKSINTEEKLQSELKDVEEQISKYRSSGISDVLKEKQQFASQEKVIDDYIHRKNEQVEKITQIANILGLEKVDFVDFGNQEVELIIKNDNNLFDINKKIITDAIDSIKNDTANLIDSINKSVWKERKERVETQYSERCSLLKEQGVDFEKLDDLLEKKKNKLLELDKIRLDKEKLIVAEKEQKKLYREYESITKEIAVLRSQFINNTIGMNANVKFDIQKGRNRNSFIKFMKDVLNKDNTTIEEEIDKLADVFFGKNGIEKFRNLMWNIRKGVDTTSCKGRMRTAIRETSLVSFAKMVTFMPEDDLRVSYKPENANKYIPLSNASAGQKTTAILTFLLAYGNLPLLLDQPEDDLDNKLVYDLIVTRLKKTKSKRQIIVVTHNANIPVNGDAEYIVSMNSEADEIDIKYEGTMDDETIRKEICDVMEGTQYAFEMRAKKYHFNIVE